MFYGIRYITRKAFAVFTFSFKFVAFASPAGGLCNCNTAAFASFKKYASHFLNSGKPDRSKKGGLCNYLFNPKSKIINQDDNGSTVAHNTPKSDVLF